MELFYPKYSIIVPTYNNLEKYLKPCVESLLRYTDFSDGSKELVIVANGCTDSTEEWVRSLNHPQITLLSFPDPLGYPKATNAGIMASRGEYVIFFNNDCLLTEQPTDRWLALMQQGFNKHVDCGLTASLMGHDSNTGHEFAIFFCAMTKRSVVEDVGYLDELFETGAGEDTTFCVEAKRKGYTIQWAPTDARPYLPPGSSYWVTDFPLFHQAEGTMHDETLVPNWQEKFDLSAKKLRQRYNENPTRHILAEICTRDRYFSTLPMTIESILAQTHKPSALLIIDNSEKKVDLRESPMYRYLFQRLMDAGIPWELIWADPGGQQKYHQLAQEKASDLVWRLDDDVVAEPDCLYNLLFNMVEGVGAVGGLVLTPPYSHLTGEKVKIPGNKIETIFTEPNKQWYLWNGPAESVDHLYCSFLYKKGIADYDLNLSPVGHREETIFTYSIKRAGYKVILTPKAKTWHYRNPEGGIRASGENHEEYWMQDDAYFRKLLNDWSVERAFDGKLFMLNNGLGDHLIFKRLLPELRAMHGKLTLSVCFPEVFAEEEGDDLKLISIADGTRFCDPKLHDVYMYAYGLSAKYPDQGKVHIEQAMREMYGLAPKRS